MGQILIVMADAGWVKVGENPVQLVRPGDVIHGRRGRSFFVRERVGADVQSSLQ
jgi:hypothetical protein